MMMLRAFDAIAACRFVSESPIPRQDDSRPNGQMASAAESAIVRAMTNAPTALPTDIDALHALIAAERVAHAAVISERNTLSIERYQLAARNAKLETTNARLEEILAEMRRARFGRKSERITEDQLALALEELETALAKVETDAEKADPALKTARAKKRRASREEILEGLPHEEVVIEPSMRSMASP